MFAIDGLPIGSYDSIWYFGGFWYSPNHPNHSKPRANIICFPKLQWYGGLESDVHERVTETNKNSMKVPKYKQTLATK